MAEKNAKLELPEPAKWKRRGKARSLVLLFACGLLGCAAAYGAWMHYSAHTPNAVIENTLLTLDARLPAQVAEVLVKKNEHVSAGQALIRLKAHTGIDAAAEVRAQVASVRNLLPPPMDMEDVARRVAEAQAAEQDLASRIMRARALEEEAARDVQRRAEEHARAQLELRRLDVLSMQYSVPRAQHDKARGDEYGARRKLEKARAAREEYSLARAAAEGELYRIKAELTEARSANGQARGMPGPVRQAAPEPSHQPSAPDSPPDSLDIVAPADAVVTDIFAQTGIWAKPGERLIALMPDVGSQEATAWFSEKDGANIQPGQMCRVFVLELPEKSFSGNVEQVLPAGSLVPQGPFAATMYGRHIPVRVRFSVRDAGTHAELKSGMRAAVRVHYFTPPWKRFGALAEKIGGKR